MRDERKKEIERQTWNGASKKKETEQEREREAFVERHSM